MMKQPESIQDVIGKRIRTHKKLGSTKGFLVVEHHIAGRQPGALGIVEGFVPGHGGDVYWVRHTEGPPNMNPSPVAAYSYTEFEIEKDE